MKTRIRRKATNLAAALAIAGTAGTAFGQDVTLQYRWTKGEEVRYRFTQQSTITVSGLPGGGGEITSETRISQVLRTRVDDIATDGTARIHYVYESARWEMASPLGAMTVDTAVSDPTTPTPMAGMMKNLLSAVIGESFDVVMSRNGQVQRVDGMSRLMEKMIASLPPDSSTAQLLPGLKGTFSDEGLRDMFALGSSEFPDRPLAPGDSWDTRRTTTNPIIGRLTTTNVSTLKTVDVNAGNRMAMITTRLTMTPGQDTGPVNPAGLTMQLGDSSGEGEVIFDLGNGRLYRSTTRTTTPMTMSGPGPDGSAMRLQTLAKSTITTELLQP